jgi:hypothetical protein
MLLLTNQSAVLPAAFPYYFAPTCTKDGCSLSDANAWVVMKNAESDSYRDDDSGVDDDGDSDKNFNHIRTTITKTNQGPRRIRHRNQHTRFHGLIQEVLMLLLLLLLLLLLKEEEGVMTLWVACASIAFVLTSFAFLQRRRFVADKWSFVWPSQRAAASSFNLATGDADVGFKDNDDDDDMQHQLQHQHHQMNAKIRVTRDITPPVQGCSCPVTGFM